MYAASLGFAGTTVAALLILLGVMHSSRPPAHLADIQGLTSLVDQLQEERDERQRIITELRDDLAKCQSALARALGARDEIRRQLRDRGDEEGV